MHFPGHFGSYIGIRHARRAGVARSRGRSAVTHGPLLSGRHYGFPWLWAPAFLIGALFSRWPLLRTSRLHREGETS